jgi:hypothetical protein
MYEEASFADEVVVIFVDSEIVNGLLMLDRRDGGNPAPLAVDGQQPVADLYLARWDPHAVLGVTTFDPEGMSCAWPQRFVLALDADLQKLVVVRAGESRDGLVLQLAGGPDFGVRPRLAAQVDEIPRGQSESARVGLRAGRRGRAGRGS